MLDGLFESKKQNPEIHLCHDDAERTYRRIFGTAISPDRDLYKGGCSQGISSTTGLRDGLIDGARLINH